jgi:hypothetical protein
MLFFLATPEYNKSQSNTTRIKVHLKNGVAEIYEQHQDLIGKIENNLVEIETNFENKIEKLLFVVQDGVFVVSNKGLDSDSKGTAIYLYAKKVREIGPNLSLSFEELTKQYDQKKIEVEAELKNLIEITNENSNVIKVTNSRILLLNNDLEFLRRALIIVKEIKV